MKYVCATWTYLETLEVPDDITPDEIEDLLDSVEPEKGAWNDRYWSLSE